MTDQDQTSNPLKNNNYLHQISAHFHLHLFIPPPPNLSLRKRHLYFVSFFTMVSRALLFVLATALLAVSSSHAYEDHQFIISLEAVDVKSPPPLPPPAKPSLPPLVKPVPIPPPPPPQPSPYKKPPTTTPSPSPSPAVPKPPTHSPAPKPPTAAPAPSPSPFVRSIKECAPLCLGRCKLHSRPNLCNRACNSCCSKCKCVPPGTSGNREKCGTCYTKWTTRMNKPKCP